MESKRPVFSRASWRVENSPGRSSMILRAGGGGRRRESTPWITPFVPNYERLELCYGKEEMIGHTILTAMILL